MSIQQPGVPSFELRLGTGGKGDPLILRNPVIAASGCFPLQTRRWMAAEVAPLGAVCTASVATRTRSSGEGFAVEESPAGLVLRGGYPTVSVRRLRDEITPRWPTVAVPLIATVGANDPEECRSVVSVLAEVEGIAAIELALTDVKRRNSTVADVSPSLRLIESVRRLWPGALIVKLPPALATTSSLPEQLETVDVDALSLGGGFAAVTPDRRSMTARGRAGRLVGPATRPLARRQVSAVMRSARLPVIAAGGVATADDVLALLAEGAVAVQVGSIALRSPLAAVVIARVVAERLAGRHASEEPGPRDPTVIG